jgi:hypothetical protein
MSIELEINREYPAGTPIDFEKHGPHSNTRYTVITSGRTILSDCRYEGYGSLFSTFNGQIITDVKFFRMQLPK